MERNMSMTKVVMPEQEPNVRNKNFSEVALGYTKEMAMEEEVSKDQKTDALTNKSGRDIHQ